MKIESFWAKTSQTSETAFHPLICHLIDVASVTRKIWQNVLPKAAKTRINQAFGVEDAENIVAFIAGLHDLGKCSPPFTLRGLHENKQTKQLLKLYSGTPFEMTSVSPSRDAPHGYVTAVELPQILENFGFNQNFSRQIGILIGGHHGIFPTSQKLTDLKIETFIGKPAWAEARKNIAQKLAGLFNIEPIQQDQNTKLNNGTMMILAGLVSVADWIGSDTQFFDCAVEDFTAEKFGLKQGSLENYLEHAETKASEALFQLGWVFQPTGNPKIEEKFLSNQEKFKKLFPFIETRRHLQDMAIEIAEELKTPGIAVIESPMGEGKTEAAMFLAETWNTNLGQKGYYFALPTQATSNQMFGRIESFLERCFPNQKSHLQLAHGHSSLSGEFGTLKKNHKRLLQGIFDDECKDENCTPNVVAAEWFTYRKRSLLAPFGVGTVDQALMAVLQTKHVFVRLFGLAHKTIIIDEVHAYDAYMSTLLERLLEWLAALGSPVIMLSATLPKNRRDALVKAYQRGLGINESNKEGEDVYPRISYATDSTIKIRNISVSTKTQTLHIEKVDDYFVENLKTKLEKDGCCTAIICNTVGRSQEIYAQLSNDEFFADKIDLLHSRFRFCDREIREKRVLEKFGKPDETGESPKRPKCAVLIATQIIEQSLDIDFDLMISDLAPIDLLLQRAGRLHRHDRERPNEFETATLWIIQPEMKEGSPDFGVHRFIYDEHILLRTWMQLQHIEQIEIPGEIENLIEAVYDLEKSNANLSESLKDVWQTSLEKCLKSIRDDNEQAENRYIKRPSYSRHISGIFTNNLDEDTPDTHKSLQALTRLTEPTTTVICLWEKDGKIFLNEEMTQVINLQQKPYLEQIKELLRCSLSISNKSVVFEFFKEEVPKGWEESALLRNHRVLLFDENRKCEKFGHIFSLDKNLGLKIIKTENENV